MDGANSLSQRLCNGVVQYDQDVPRIFGRHSLAGCYGVGKMLVNRVCERDYRALAAKVPDGCCCIVGDRAFD